LICTLLLSVDYINIQQIAYEGFRFSIESVKTVNRRGDKLLAKGIVY